jgi:hypothetical protein
MSKEWRPQCVLNTATGRSFGSSAKGYLTPCCWIDFSFYKDIEELRSDDPQLVSLFEEHLKIKNNDSIEEILLSDEWIEFYDNLASVDTAPKTCKRYCYKNRDLWLFELKKEKFNTKEEE